MANFHYYQVAGSAEGGANVNKTFAGDGSTTIDTGNQIFIVNFQGASTAAQTAYIAVPFACNLVSGRSTVASGTVGTGASVNVYLTDTAGSSLFGAATFTSAGTAGQQTLVLGTMSTAQIAQAGVIAVVQSSCATAYGATVVITATKSGN